MNYVVPEGDGIGALQALNEAFGVMRRVGFPRFGGHSVSPMNLSTEAGEAQLQTCNQ